MDDLKQVWQKLHKDVSAASYPTTWDTSTPRGRELDAMSIVDWIEESVPGGIGSRLGQLLDVAYTIEYGADSSEQSSLNLLYLLGYSGQGQLRIFGPSNEKYHVAGGNDQLTDRMAQALPGQIATGTELVAVKLNAGGTYTLTFKKGSGTTSVTADHVVLALPFSILRRSVDLSKAGFEPRKLTAINEQGMGTNSTPSSRAGTGTTSARTAKPSPTRVTRTRGRSRAASRARPGSYWKPGQYTKFAGFERERQGNCHFAGEHCSLDFQGYLNGAVETGERAAAEILADFK